MPEKNNNCDLIPFNELMNRNCANSCLKSDPSDPPEAGESVVYLKRTAEVRAFATIPITDIVTPGRYAFFYTTTIKLGVLDGDLIYTLTYYFPELENGAELQVQIYREGVETINIDYDLAADKQVIVANDRLHSNDLILIRNRGETPLTLNLNEEGYSVRTSLSYTPSL